MMQMMRRLVIWMMAGAASRADVTLPQTLAGRCWRSWGSFFPNFRGPKRQLQHPQQAKHLQHDGGSDTCRMMQVKLGMRRLPFFTTFPDQTGSSHIPSMQSITPTFENQKGSSCIPSMQSIAPGTCAMMRMMLGMIKPMMMALTMMMLKNDAEDDDAVSFPLSSVIFPSSSVSFP